MLDTFDSSVGEVIEPAAVSNLPLNGRMLIDLALTVPGAHLSHGAQAGDMNNKMRGAQSLHSQWVSALVFDVLQENFKSGTADRAQKKAPEP